MINSKGLSLQKLAKLVGTLVQWWRSPALVKAAWAVIVAGLGILTPGFRDILLVALPLLINRLFDLLNIPHLPAIDSIPWWAGLILVVAGLLVLMWRSRRKSLEIDVKSTPDGFNVKITAPDEVLQSPNLEQILERALQERARQAPPPAPPELNE